MLKRMVCTAVLLVSPVAADVLSLGFIPASQSANVGGSTSVNLAISGLGNHTAPSLGDYDLVINFDSGILAFNSLIFGDPILGDQLDLFGLGNVNGFQPLGAGSLNLFEVSLDSAADLDSMQNASFILATLRFDVMSAGTSTLSIGINSLGDSLGNPLSVDTATGAITAVPELGTSSLLGSLLYGIYAGRRWFRLNQKP